MPTKLRALLLISIALAGTALVRISHAQSSGDSEKAEVMALNQRLIAAYDKGDVAAAMACYSDDPDAIFFEDTIPFQFNKAAVTKANELFYKSVANFHASMEGAVNVQVSGNLAVAHYIVASSWSDKTGTHSQTSRYTQVDRKEGGKWFIWHEHFSVPFDPATGQAVLDAKS